jgi:SAM-dependent methyltransferase
MRKRTDPTALAFEALTIEGGLLAPAILTRVAQLEAGEQAATDYRVPKGLHLRDEIGRYWRIAQAHWADFAHARVRAADPELSATQFVQALLKEVFGFGTLQAQLPLERDGRLYPLGLNALDGRVPVVIAPAGLGLDKAHTQFGDGQRRRTAFGLLQEYLNATDAALWGMVSDGVVLRLARDNGSLTRPAWIEADLGRIFAEERFADFTALWLLIHESRFGRVGTLASECALENWRQAGQAEGVRARDHLRLGVEAAILELGQGFLSHPDNGALRADLQAGQLMPQGYFQELLRLVYRVIFLLTAEEREVLHPQETAEAVKTLYAEGYGVRRLRDRAVRRSALDRHTDLWQGLGITWRGLAHGEPVLGLPALGGLFASAQCPHLDNARLENRVLLGALFRLCWLREPSGLSRVNWRDMGPEELGSVYESLLELVPQIRDGGRIFAFGEGDETRGNARKVSGSYYTPDSLVQLLLDSALEPVIAQTVAAHPGQAAEALLRLSVLDPACGSGHFLLAAARRLAAHVARHAVDGTPTAADYRRALRQVVGNCVYGVDRNPMALELARTALWLEAMTPEAPLTFLDHHLVCGDALVGLQSLDVLKVGIPKEAFKALSGDDAAVVKRLAASNRNELKRMAQVQGGQLVLGLSGIDWVEALQRVEAMPDDSLDAIAAKQAATLAARQTGLASAPPQRLAADLYVTAFLAPKTAETERLIPTSATIGNALAGLLPNQEMLAFAEDLTGRMSVLHWPITFAHILARGGFDCVLGNPPWERIKLQEKEFFAPRSEAIANAQNSAERQKLIAALRSPSASPAG